MPEIHELPSGPLIGMLSAILLTTLVLPGSARAAPAAVSPEPTFERPPLPPAAGWRSAVANKARWLFEGPTTGAQERVVRVCWEPTDGEYSQEKRWVQEQAEETWGKHGEITFVGWKRCAPRASGVRILLHRKFFLFASTIGRFLDGAQNAVVLGAGQFGDKRGSNPWLDACTLGASDRRADYERCFRWQATHMFGHVLGIWHAEAGEPYKQELCTIGAHDTPPALKDLMSGIVGSNQASEPSPTSVDESVMSPCPSLRTMSAPRIALTPRDISDLRRTYCGPGDSCRTSDAPNEP